jgi:hypothetical protein
MPNDTNRFQTNQDMVRRRFVELDKGNFGTLDEPGFSASARAVRT